MPGYRASGLGPGRALGRSAGRAQRFGASPEPHSRDEESHRRPPRRPPAGSGHPRQRGDRSDRAQHQDGRIRRPASRGRWNPRGRGPVVRRVGCISPRPPDPHSTVRQEEGMKRAGLLLAVILLAASCATLSPPQGQDLVNRAVKAVGGADALAGVKTLSVEGTVRQWEPEQSMAAGGEMRFACASTFVFASDVASGATRIDWVRNFQYPAPRTFTFSEIVTPDAGYVAGIDSNGRTKQRDRKSTRLNSSHLGISYAVFCLKQKKTVSDCSR